MTPIRLSPYGYLPAGFHATSYQIFQFPIFSRAPTFKTNFPNSPLAKIGWPQNRLSNLSFVPKEITSFTHPPISYFEGGSEDKKKSWRRPRCNSEIVQRPASCIGGSLRRGPVHGGCVNGQLLLTYPRQYPATRLQHPSLYLCYEPYNEIFW